VRIPTLRQFKQCKSIPDFMLEIVHLAINKSCKNNREHNSYDFLPVLNKGDQDQMLVRDMASDLVLHSLKVLMVGNRTTAQ